MGKWRVKQSRGEAGMVISSGKRSPRGIQTPLTYLTSGPTFPSQVHCISTEFTPRKHGGEKGVPFRVQIDTFKQNENGEYTEHLHSASCQIKVFKVGCSYTTRPGQPTLVVAEPSWMCGLHELLSDFWLLPLASLLLLLKLLGRGVSPCQYKALLLQE